ncbi:MAG TPA: LUD domain-containing protein [Puia sp.]|jgi:L-lactate dehydrogenase complex protein LldG
MKVSPAKENILKRIRQALTEPTPIPFPQSEGNSSVYRPSSQEKEIEFAEQLAQVQGKFIYCADQDEMLRQLKLLIAKNAWAQIFCRETALRRILDEPLKGLLTAGGLPEADASITSCELLIARTGSILLSAAQESGRTVSVYAPVHICIAYSNQLVYDIREGLEFLQDKYKKGLPSLITLASGPSRTADIEKTLVVGVHGPKDVYVFLIDAE